MSALRLSGWLVFAMVMAAPAAEQPVVNLKDAPPNTWVPIGRWPTGWRDQPVFVYAANIRRFVMAAGYQTYGGIAPRHYDTEEFDPVAVKWVNAYPPDVAAGRPESGPVGEEYARRVEKIGHNGFEMFYRDGAHLRLAAGGQWVETRGYHEYCYVPDTGMIYVYMHDKTLCYDPVRRTWEDLRAVPRSGCRIWGAMCYDPVNREIVHAGGDGAGDQVRTWLYSIDRNEWRVLECGWRQLKELHVRARQLCRDAEAMVGAACNRFAISETDEEAGADLAAVAGRVAQAAETLAAEAARADAAPHEKVACAMAAVRLRSAAVLAKECALLLGKQIAPETIGRTRDLHALLEKAADALAPEPPGRARSPLAYDGAARKVVLFGGDGLDRVRGDTWVYDCASRRWEQRFPEPSPAPRAGHILAWLPQTKKIVMAGGYDRRRLPQDVWVYDVAANAWKPLLCMPAAEGKAASGPRADERGIQVGGVGDDDVLMCLGPGNPGLVVWACRVDAGAPDASAEKVTRSAPGEYTFNPTVEPAEWEKAANPDREQAMRFLKGLAPNRWTAMKFARYAPGATNRWGTTAYDTARHQFLFWGGGHATSKENDVAHFSVRGSCWTIGYRPDDPIERVYASQPTPLSFAGRPHVPVHAYKAYCFDPPSRMMLYLERAYDPGGRLWLVEACAGLRHKGVMYSVMEPTPAGAVCLSSEGLFRFDARERRWVQLPWEGPRPQRMWCDGHSVCYDSRRDCLWVTTEKEIYRYDFATGRASVSVPEKPKALGQFLFWGEEAYIPEADLVLIMKLFRRPDGRVGNAVWNPQDGRFYWTNLTFVEDGREVAMKEGALSWHDAIAYDPALRIVLLNNSSARKVWALRFDRETAGMEEMKD